MTDADWESPLNYDMVLNTERMPIDDCVRQVRSLAESAAFEENERSRAILDDLTIEARLRATVAGDPELGGMVRNLDITVHDGVAHVRGVVQDKGAGADFCRTLEALPDVRAVESRLFVPGAYAS